MLMFSQDPYKKICSHFILAKKSKNSKKIIDSLLLFISTLKKILENLQSHKQLSLFVSDPQMIFEKRHKELSIEKLETEIFSTGFLDQLLETLNISEHKKISENISDSIFDLYSEMSKKNKNISDEKNKLIQHLDFLNKLILK